MRPASAAPGPALIALLLVAAGGALASSPPSPTTRGPIAAPVAGSHAEGFSTVVEADLERHIAFLASPELEGRDSPSAGLARAAEYAAEVFRAAGLVDVEGVTADFRATYVQSSADRQPIAVALPEKCRLELAAEVPEGTPDSGEGASFEALEYGVDFVPVAGGGGEAVGEPVFLGFGIDSKKEPYNDLKGTSWRGKIAVVLEGEPRHRRLFEGSEEVTEEADLYWKVEELEERGAKGVLCVRRPPEVPKRRAVEPGPTPLSFRHSWAHFKDHQPPRVRGFEIPVLEITPAAAERILGRDVLEVAEGIDKRGKPERIEVPGRLVRLASATGSGQVEVDNVVGVLRGSDPAVADEYVVIGAHYDHLGVDPRGRIGYGADDNATGVAAVLEIVEAMAEARPRRSILAVLFAGEEDGLLGSRALCAAPPVPLERVVAMVNMDMLGRGETDEILLLGAQRIPEFEDLAERARKLKSTRIRDVVTNRGQDLFSRSDHFSFHEAGVPALFFYEGWPETENEDYHTFEDTLERLDLDKVTRSARLVFNVVWLLANDEEKPPRPR